MDDNGGHLLFLKAGNDVVVVRRPTYQCNRLDQDLDTWRSHEDVPLAGVPRGVKLESRWRRQVGLPEHGKTHDSEAHLQGRTEGPQAGGDGAEGMKQEREDGKTSHGWRSHGDVGSPEQA